MTFGLWQGTRRLPSIRIAVIAFACLAGTLCAPSGAAAAPTIAVDDVTVTEGNSDTTRATFTISLSSASVSPVTVDTNTATGSAGHPRDFWMRATTTLSFAPGETTKQINVYVVGDAVDEFDEQFALNLSNATNATIGDGQGLGTITDDDAQPTISINDVSKAEGNSGNSGALFTISLSGPSEKPVSVDTQTSGGTATAGTDYWVRGLKTISFGGATSQQLAVYVLGDTDDEDDETFNLDLSNATNATIADNRGVGTIADDDDPPTISVDDVTAVEGDSGQTGFLFTVSLDRKAKGPVTVDTQTSLGTAGTSDYWARGPKTLTFPAGTRTQQLNVYVTGDRVDEDNETFNLDLSNPTGATIADSRGVGTITDDDATPTLSIDDVSKAEGNSGSSGALFTVSLSGPSQRQITVNLAAGGGTATKDADYFRSSTTLTFAPGSTRQQINAWVRGDNIDEFDQTFNMSLSGAANATISDAVGVGTITDDDAEPTIAIGDIAKAEGNSGLTTAVFTLTLSRPSEKGVTVKSGIYDGSAVGGATDGDYKARETNPATYTFAPGTSTLQLPTYVRGDVLDEINEEYFMILTDPTSATIADPTGVITITDDDAEPTVSVQSSASVTEPATGSTTHNVTISLSAVSAKPVQVGFATADSTAQGDVDYGFVGYRSVVVPAGQSSVTTPVSILSDNFREVSESFTVKLLDISNATAGTTTGSVTIGANCYDNEPNFQATAIDLGTVSGNLGSDMRVGPPGTSICGNAEEDWFKFTMRDDGTGGFLSATVDLDMRDLPGDGDLDLLIFEADGSEYASSENFGTVDESVRITIDDTSADDTKTFWVLVGGYPPATSTNDYVLRVTGNT